MVASLKTIVTIQPGGVVRIQSDRLREGALAEVVITTDVPEKDLSNDMTWEAFIGAGGSTRRTADEIDSAISQLRDEWS